MLEPEQYQSGRSTGSDTRSSGRGARSSAADPGLIRGSTARDIAASAEAAIREGHLATSDALPTVRALAERLGTSPATVSSAYRTLRQRGLVIADGRRGTRVAPRPALRVPRPPRLAFARPARRDLTIGLADPELLPPIEPALASIDLDKLQLDSPDPDLVEIYSRLFARDGVPVDALTVVGGALDGVERVLAAHLRPGDRVVVEDPAYPPIRDLLLALGLVAVPVDVDDFGLIPERLEVALGRGIDALVAIPRAQNPYGSAFDADRASELRALLAPHSGMLLVEDDHAWEIAGSEFFSLIEPGWPRWAVIRTASKVLHPDLRIAMLAGDETTVARVEGRQALGPRWVSHILQATAASLMRDRSFSSRCRRARDLYTERRAAMIGALAEYGIDAHGRSGLNVWVPVREEAAVVRALLDSGWLVMAGENFRFNSRPGIRVTVSTVSQDEASGIAAVIAAIEQAGRPRRSY